MLSGECGLTPSANEYDWLGPGIYFWENDPERALAFATEAVSRDTKTTKGKIVQPFVVGAIIDLGLCCNLLNRDALSELEAAHTSLVKLAKRAKVDLPKNASGPDKRMRMLDCAVIKTMHDLRKKQKRKQLPPYQTVRGAFWEGDRLYPGSEFSKKGHVQIAVISESCIRGYFRPIATT